MRRRMEVKTSEKLHLIVVGECNLDISLLLSLTAIPVQSKINSLGKLQLQLTRNRVDFYLSSIQAI